jgi:low temperature requirement protein LtrA
LHGREDGRTRSLVFVQMGILAVLAVYTGSAGHDGGQPFALVYGTFLTVMMLAWNGVRRQDRRYRPEFLAVTGRYQALLIGSLLVMVPSAFLSDDLRLLVWAVYSAAWLVAFWVLDRARRAGLPITIAPTESLVERFGTFTIIVLGEVVIGVVAGMSQGQHDLTTIGTGVIALLVGFGLWWIYFDLVGNRLAREGHGVVDWVLSHFPITLSIAGGGAAMVSLVAHAHDAVTPLETAWLLSGAVALGLIGHIVAMRSLVDAQRLASVYAPMSRAMAIAAVVALALGWLHPAPWLLAAGIVAVLSVLWFIAVGLFIRADAWGEERETGDSGSPTAA